VKGLEFDHMFIAGANEGVIPLAYAVQDASDETTRQERELAERSLLYVAATRAKRHVLVTSHGKPSPFLNAN
jgi:superfamily I DNA/RNA helicase